MLKGKRSRIVNIILEKKEKMAELRLPVFKTQSKAAVIKTLWSWQKNKHEDQWNRVQSPEIGSPKCGQLILNTEAKTIQ